MRFALILLSMILVTACEPTANGNPYDNDKEPILVNVDSNTVKQKFGARCEIIETCNDMSYIDCLSAADGPAYYVKGQEMEILMRCGGACMGPRDGSNDPLNCVQCPPKEWSC